MALLPQGPSLARVLRSPSPCCTIHNMDNRQILAVGGSSGLGRGLANAGPCPGHGPPPGQPGAAPRFASSRVGGGGGLLYVLPVRRTLAPYGP